MASELIDTVLYSKHHGLQKQDTCDFYKLCAALLNWSDISQDVILDVGCGPGNASSKWLLTLFPDILKLIAVDISENVIQHALMLNPNPKIEYCVADISDKSSLKLWEGKISKVFSSFCFHWIDNQKNAFQKVFNLLRPGGEAAMLISLFTEHYSPYHCYRDMVNHPKWSKYAKETDYKIRESYSKKWGFSHYENVINEVGFEVILCKQEEKTFVFQTDDECISCCMAVCPLLLSIPRQLKEEFERDYFRHFMERHERDSSGRPTFNHSLLHVIIKKPDGNTSKNTAI